MSRIPTKREVRIILSKDKIDFHQLCKDIYEVLEPRIKGSPASINAKETDAPLYKDK